MQRRMLSSIGLLAGICICFCTTNLQAEEAATAAAGQSSKLANEAAIRRALDDKTEVEFVETPLEAVVSFLADTHKIQIRLDKKALDDAGLGTDTPITLNVRNISLRSVLQLMLKEFDLAWVIENEVLLITTIDEAEMKLAPKVYDVADLVTTEDGIDYDSLIETITTSAAPYSWQAVGGPGSITLLHRMLVLNQTAAVHEQVAALLAEMRRVRKERGDKIVVVPSDEAAPADQQTLSVKVYRVSVPMMPGPITKPATEKPAAAKPKSAGVIQSVPAHELAEFGGGRMVVGGWGVPNDQYLAALAVAIPNLVQPESWIKNGGPGTVYALPANSNGEGQLLVRQTGEVHKQLRTFLKELAPHGMCGGMGGGGHF